MEVHTYKISPVLTIKLKTSNKVLINQFTTRFSDLFTDTDVSDYHITLSLTEVPDFVIYSKKVLREITLPEYFVYDEEDFLIVQNRRYISIPFNEIGIKKNLEIKFEKDFPPDWIRRLIDDILAFHVSGFGMSFVHAACLSRSGKNIIIPAWRGTGKTTLTLSLLFGNHFGYKAEDQFFIDREANCYIYTDACHLDRNHIEDFPQVRNKYFSIIHLLRSSLTSILLPFFPPVNPVFEFVRRVILKVFSPKVYVKIRDFIPDLQLDHDNGKELILMQLITQPNLKEPIIEETETNQLVEKILGGMQYERLDLYPYYYAWVYASGKRNGIIDNVHKIEKDILISALTNAKSYRILIPMKFDWSSYTSEINKIFN